VHDQLGVIPEQLINHVTKQKRYQEITNL